jgi:hypothetical protein
MKNAMFKEGLADFLRQQREDILFKMKALEESLGRLEKLGQWEEARKAREALKGKQDNARD